MNFDVSYYKKTYDYKNDNDILISWDGTEAILSNVLYGYYLEKLTTEEPFNWLIIYEGQLNEYWQNLQRAKAIEQVPRMRSRVEKGYRRSLYG